jgi:predicted transcriptional regulator of viral defense system
MVLTKELKNYFKDFSVFTIRDVKLFCQKFKVNKNYISLLLHNLLKNHELIRITKGKYTFQRDIQIVGFAFSPFYYGLQDALSLRNLWTQETNPVVITPLKVRSGLRTFLDGNYIVRRIDRKMFFGYEMIKYRDFWIPVSDIEKTLIDFVYFKEPLSNEVLGEIKQKINKEKLRAYLKKSPKFVQRRIKILLKM